MLFHEQHLSIAKLRQQEVERKAIHGWKFINRNLISSKTKRDVSIETKHNCCVPIQQM